MICYMYRNFCFTLKGKVFLGQALGATGAELSYQTLVPGQDSGFLHTHKQFPVKEGAVVRVAPEGKRALKNTGKENLTMLCIQYKANAFTDADSPMTDGNILNEPLNW